MKEIMIRKGELSMPYCSDACGRRWFKRGLRPLLMFAVLTMLVQLPSVALAEKKSYRYEDDPVRLGTKALEEGDLAEAERFFNEAIENEHQIHKARYGLGEVLYQNGSYADAEPLYRQAIVEKNMETGKPDFPDAHASLGLVLLRLDRGAEANGEFEQALSEKRGVWKAHYGLARIALDEERYRDAEKNLEKGKKRKGITDGEDLYCYGGI